MSIHSQDSSIAFLLGAGFSVDAALDVNAPDSARYPMVSALAKVCFDLDEPPHDKSIEELFQNAIYENNYEPLEKLYKQIMKADYDLTPQLLPGGCQQGNPYLKMLQDFPSAPILTFNYDSLVEILLFNLGKWRPGNGYGIPVRVEHSFPFDSLAPLPENSLRTVLHLHGTLCVYKSEFDIEKGDSLDIGSSIKPKKEPSFSFDPGAITWCFPTYGSVASEIDFQYQRDRVIAPVPCKAEGLHGEFVSRIHMQALKIVQSTRIIVSIGYSFNPHDRDSYVHFLDAAHGARIILVTPEAHNIVSRLRAEHPKIKWQPISMTFREWVTQEYVGL